ncbi:MAG: lysophospholipid acyltransferase family protein [Burkholderiaceae bacterium]
MASYVVCVIYAGILIISLTLVASIPVALAPRPTRVRTTRYCIHLLFRAIVHSWRVMGLFKGKVAALDSLPAEGPMVVIANHPGLMDFVFIASRLPNAVCIMKSEIAWNPFVGIGARLAGYVPNATSHGLVRESVQALNEGGQVVIFPEGTRTRTQPMESMTGAFVTIAKRAGVPIEMITIDCDSRFLSKGWPLWRIPAFPIHYWFERLGPVDPALDREATLVAVRETYQTALADSPGVTLLRKDERAVVEQSHH